MSDTKTLLVLGASSDVGKALIKDIGNNYDVIIAHYRSDDKFIEELQDDISSEIIGYKADFSSGEEINKLSGFVRGYDVDHVVHLSADNMSLSKFHKGTWEDFHRSLSISMEPIVAVLQAVIPKMIKKKSGKIIFMLSSVVDGRIPKYQSIYGSTKYALLGLMKSLSVDYADKNIQVNGVSPEMMDTKFLDNLSDHIVEKNALDSPRGRNLKVEEVVPAIRFLLSEEADVITGQNIVINAGK